MPRDIKLSGSEISVLKRIGLSGTQVYGKLLLDKVEPAEAVEFVETLSDLVAVGYVLSNKVNIRRIEEVQTAFFRVAPAYARELRDAIVPSKGRDERRTRRERRG